MSNAKYEGSGWGVRIQVPAFRTNGIQVNAIWCRTEEKAKQIATDLNVPFGTIKALPYN